LTVVNTYEYIQFAPGVESEEVSEQVFYFVVLDPIDHWCIKYTPYQKDRNQNTV